MFTVSDKKPNAGHGLPGGANPYQRLTYIHNLVKFYKELGDEVSISDLKSMMIELTDITQKYRKG